LELRQENARSTYLNAERFTSCDAATIVQFITQVLVRRREQHLRFIGCVRSEAKRRTTATTWDTKQGHSPPATSNTSFSTSKTIKLAKRRKLDMCLYVHCF
jgi:hypothetical protein